MPSHLSPPQKPVSKLRGVEGGDIRSSRQPARCYLCDAAKSAEKSLKDHRIVIAAKRVVEVEERRRKLVADRPSVLYMKRIEAWRIKFDRTMNSFRIALNRLLRAIKGFDLKRAGKRSGSRRKASNTK